MRTCPYCAEEISGNARVCPYCDAAVGGGSRGSRSRTRERRDDYEPPRRSSSRPRKSNNTMIIVLIVVGVVVVLGIGGTALFLPAVQQAREASRRSACRDNLKQIVIALHLYHERYHSFPPAVTVDAQGKPLYSWRVLLLPYLEEESLYRQLDLSKAWDDPKNRQLLDRMPRVYGCPTHPDSHGNRTCYMAAYGPNCVFRPGSPVKFRDVVDGTANTAIVGEVTGAGVHWAKPGDIDVGLYTNLVDANGFSSHHRGGCHFAFADGSVRYIEDTIDPDTLRDLFGINDMR